MPKKLKPHAPPEPPGAITRAADDSDSDNLPSPPKRKQKMCEDCHIKCAGFGYKIDNKRRWCAPSIA
jgi:hypothetical protein